MNKSRLESFSDGVFAVAITLLALDLSVDGHKRLLPQFAGLWPAVVAYLISFFTIGIIWVNHHRILNDVQVVTRSLLFINLILLAVTVAIPFATSTLADYLTDGGQSGHLAAALYAGVFELMSLSFLPLYEWVLRHDHCVRHPLPAAAKNPARLRFYAGQVPYLIAVGVAFLSAPAAVVITAVVAVYYVFVRETTGPPASSFPPAPPEASEAELGGSRPASRVVTIALAWAAATAADQPAGPGPVRPHDRPQRGEEDRADRRGRRDPGRPGRSGHHRARGGVGY